MDQKRLVLWIVCVLSITTALSRKEYRILKQYGSHVRLVAEGEGMVDTLMRMLTVCCFCAVVSCAPPTAIFTVPEKRMCPAHGGDAPRASHSRVWSPCWDLHGQRYGGVARRVSVSARIFQRGAVGDVSWQPGGHVHYRCWSRTLGHEYGGECEI